MLMEFPISLYHWLGLLAHIPKLICSILLLVREVVFVLWDDLKMTSGLRTPTAFNGQNFFFKIAESKVLDKYYNSYLKK